MFIQRIGVMMQGIKVCAVPIRRVLRVQPPVHACAIILGFGIAILDFALLFAHFH